MLPLLTIFPQLDGRVEERLLLWWTPQVTESDGSLPEVGLQVRTYSDYLRAA